MRANRSKPETVFQELAMILGWKGKEIRSSTIDPEIMKTRGTSGRRERRLNKGGKKR